MEQILIQAIIGGLFSLGGVWLKHVLERSSAATAGGGTTVSVPSTASGFPIGRALIDVGIVFMLTAIGGFVLESFSGLPISISSN